MGENDTNQGGGQGQGNPGFVGERTQGGNVKAPEYEGPRPFHEADALIKTAMGDRETVLTGSQAESGPADGLKASARLVGPPLVPSQRSKDATTATYLRKGGGVASVAGVNPHHMPTMDAPTVVHEMAGDGMRVVGRHHADAGKDWNPYDPDQAGTAGRTFEKVPGHVSGAMGAQPIAQGGAPNAQGATQPQYGTHPLENMVGEKDKAGAQQPPAAGGKQDKAADPKPGEKK